MEQGTGKTRTTLELVSKRLDADKVDYVLWLCPCSVKKNLREDLEYHCEEYPSQIIIRGIESLSSSDRLYLQLMELVEKKRVFLVVDESNLTKNKDAIRTARIINLSKACKYKLILNGTPVSRTEEDLFAQWYILDWRILGYQSYYSFAANHLEYRRVLLPNGRKIIDRNRVARVLNTDYLTEKIAPYSFQIRKSECMKDLPGKIYRSALFSLSPEQREIYYDVRDRYLENVSEFQSETIYKLFAALQHVTSGRNVITEPEETMVTEPIFEKDEDNPRIKALMEAVENVGSEKCIIFAKYQAEIDSIVEMLKRSGKTCVMFTGKVTQKQRQINRKKFRDEAQFLVANKVCGAYGLNLQFCHNIIYYNNDFDLATRMQSEDRCHRIGQTHEVVIYDVYSFDSIDHFIYRCLIRKENMVDKFKERLHELKERNND